ncbi:MAG: hypothetical protein ABIN97_18975 [Ginsengibacter sp.]
MKKLMSILLFTGLLITATAFTGKDDTVSVPVKSAFEKTFTTATDVEWKKINEFYLASFKLNSQNCTASYNAEGKLMRASRNITLSELPLNILLALQDEYAAYTIDKIVTEVTADGDSNYFIKGENAKHNISIKASPAGVLSIENKTKRK